MFPFHRVIHVSDRDVPCLQHEHENNRPRGLGGDPLRSHQGFPTQAKERLATYIVLRAPRTCLALPFYKTNYRCLLSKLRETSRSLLHQFLRVEITRIELVGDCCARLTLMIFSSGLSDSLPLIVSFPPSPKNAASDKGGHLFFKRAPARCES